MKIALITTDNREHRKDYSNPVPHFGTAPEALIQGFSMLPDVEVHVICCVRQHMKSPEKLADNIWYHPVFMPKIGWLTTAYLGCIYAVRRKLHEIKPDIVHGQGTERDSAVCAALSGYPNVLTIHGNMRIIAKLNKARPFSYEWLVAKLESFTIPRSDGVVCITEYTRDAVQDLAQRTWVLPNATDARFFEIKPSRGKMPHILVVGNICSRKNQNSFIRAISPIVADQPLKLSFFGGVDKTSQYGNEFLDLLKDRPWCEWGGFIGREALREELGKATALVLPSIEDNCPMVVLEAMAAGVPVIAGNVGGVPDLVKDNINGLLCDPHSESDMRSKMASLLDDSSRTQKMAEVAKEMALKQFHPRFIASKHLEIYQEVLSGYEPR